MPQPLIAKLSVFKPNLVDPTLDKSDPNPDIVRLFHEFNRSFFNGSLANVVVKWSTKMTQCAGKCYFRTSSANYCTIRLSAPLLHQRRRRDTVETLLHEMIHAYTDIAYKYRGHGRFFKLHMERINREAGTNITIYHNFHDEVESCRVYWFQCNGPCKRLGPIYGLVKKAQNQPPGPFHRWWREHEHTCGGTFSRVPNYNQSSLAEQMAKLTVTPHQSSANPPLPKYNAPSIRSHTNRAEFKAKSDTTDNEPLRKFCHFTANSSPLTTRDTNKSPYLLSPSSPPQIAKPIPKSLPVTKLGSKLVPTCFNPKTHAVAKAVQKFTNTPNMKRGVRNITFSSDDDSPLFPPNKAKVMVGSDPAVKIETGVDKENSPAPFVGLSVSSKRFKMVRDLFESDSDDDLGCSPVSKPKQKPTAGRIKTPKWIKKQNIRQSFIDDFEIERGCSDHNLSSDLNYSLEVPSIACAESSDEESDGEDHDQYYSMMESLYDLELSRQSQMNS